MMLGMFHLLPYLKGWEYKLRSLERTVSRGADPVELSIAEEGWLISIGEFTDDCYGTCIISWQGADLETKTVRANPEAFRVIGALAQDPAGWLQRYTRPNPASTAGIYLAVVFSGGLQGAVWPYVPTVKLAIHLPEESTQQSAYISLGAITIIITDPKAFLVSLRKALGIKGKIDPALLVTGPVELEEEES